MGRLTDEEKERWHDRGQKDGSNGHGRNGPSAPFLDDLFDVGRRDEAWEAYESGLDNGHNNPKR